jgi:hypothetical protein
MTVPNQSLPARMLRGWIIGWLQDASGSLRWFWWNGTHWDSLERAKGYRDKDEADVVAVGLRLSTDHGEIRVQ